MIPTPSEDISPNQARPIMEPVDPSQFPAIARLMMPDATKMAFDGTAPTGHTIRIDTGPASGGEGTGSEPKALLLIALGTCTEVDVISILHKKRHVVSS